MADDAINNFSSAAAMAAAERRRRTPTLTPPPPPEPHQDSSSSSSSGGFGELRRIPTMAFGHCDLLPTHTTPRGHTRSAAQVAMEKVIEHDDKWFAHIHALRTSPAPLMSVQDPVVMAPTDEAGRIGSPVVSSGQNFHRTSSMVILGSSNSPITPQPGKASGGGAPDFARASSMFGMPTASSPTHRSRNASVNTLATSKPPVGLAPAVPAPVTSSTSSKRFSVGGAGDPAAPNPSSSSSSGIEKAPQLQRQSSWAASRNSTGAAPSGKDEIQPAFRLSLNKPPPGPPTTSSTNLTRFPKYRSESASRNGAGVTRTASDHGVVGLASGPATSSTSSASGVSGAIERASSLSPKHFRSHATSSNRVADPVPKPEAVISSSSTSVATTSSSKRFSIGPGVGDGGPEVMQGFQKMTVATADGDLVPTSVAPYIRASSPHRPGGGGAPPTTSMAFASSISPQRPRPSAPHATDECSAPAPQHHRPVPGEVAINRLGLSRAASSPRLLESPRGIGGVGAGPDGLSPDSGGGVLNSPRRLVHSSSSPRLLGNVPTPILFVNKPTSSSSSAGGGGPNAQSSSPMFTKATPSFSSISTATTPSSSTSPPSAPLPMSSAAASSSGSAAAHPSADRPVPPQRSSSPSPQQEAEAFRVSRRYTLNPSSSATSPPPSSFSNIGTSSSPVPPAPGSGGGERRVIRSSSANKVASSSKSSGWTGIQPVAGLSMGAPSPKGRPPTAPSMTHSASPNAMTMSSPTNLRASPGGGPANASNSKPRITTSTAPIAPRALGISLPTGSSSSSLATAIPVRPPSSMANEAAAVAATGAMMSALAPPITRGFSLTAPPPPTTALVSGAPPMPFHPAAAVAVPSGPNNVLYGAANTQFKNMLHPEWV